MKKRPIIVILLLMAAVLIQSMQSCKKSDSADDTTTPPDTVLFQTYVNGVLWTPTAKNIVLTYDAAAQTKTFSFTADSAQTDRILLSIKQPATTADSTFAIQTYAADTTATPNIITAYYKLINNVYTSVGTLKSGNISISAIDPVKKLVTGTFAFTEIKYNYDPNGNIISFTSTGITSGEFNNLPYTFKKQ